MRNIKLTVIGIITIIVLLVSGGCLIPPVQLSPPQPAPAPSPAPSTVPQPVAPAPVPEPAPFTQPSTGPINPAWTPPEVDGTSPVLPDFVSVIAKVKPAVVAIKTTVPAFNIFTGSSVQEGAGSGWIISEDGYVVTNNHVVEGAESIEVTLDDGRTFSAQTVKADSLADLAVVKIDAKGLPAARIGDSSKLNVGEWVVAIGNSLGLGISATKGIVSVLNASLPVGAGETLTDLIQTDAAINPGNSGGPLVNMAGEVVGINSAKVAEVGVEGMGYSISTKVALPIIEQLIKTGFVVRAWLGVGLYTVDEYVARRYSLPVTEGVIITQIAANSPAAQAGLKVGDVITAFNGQKVTGDGELVRAIHLAKVGQTVEIIYWRGKAQATASVVLAQSPPSR